MALTWITPAGTITGFNKLGNNASMQLLTVSDTDDTVTYSVVIGTLPSNMELSASGMLSITNITTITTETIFTVNATAKNKLGVITATASRQFKVSIYSFPINWITPAGTITGFTKIGKNATVNILADGGTSQPMEYVVTAGPLPIEMTLSVDGTILIIDLADTITTEITFTVTATVKDNLGNIIETKDREFKVSPNNSFIMSWLTPKKIGTFTETAPLSYPLVVENTTADSLEFTLLDGSVLPLGVALSKNGIISGAPIIRDTGAPQEWSFHVLVRAFDGSGLPTRQISGMFTITIEPWMKWLTKAGSLGTYAAYQPMSYKVEAYRPVAGPISFIRYFFYGVTSTVGRISASITVTGGYVASAEQRYVADIVKSPTNTVISVNVITPDNIISIGEHTGNITISGLVAGKFSIKDKISLSVNDKSFTNATDLLLSNDNYSATYSIDVPAYDLIRSIDRQVKVSITGTNGTSATATRYYGITADVITYCETHDIDGVLITTSHKPSIIGKGISSPVNTTIILDPITGTNLIDVTPLSVLPPLRTIDLTGTVTGLFKTGDIVTISFNNKIVTGTVLSTGKFTITVPLTEPVSACYLPVGLTLDFNTGIISGKPTTTDILSRSTFSIKADACTFNGIVLDSQVREFTIDVDMWALPPNGGLQQNLLGNYSGGVPIHPLLVVCSPDTDGNIEYAIEGNNNLTLKKILIKYQGFENVQACQVMGIPEVVAEDTQYSFTITVNKSTSNNRQERSSRTFYYVVLAKTVPMWQNPPGHIGNYKEGQSINYVFTAKPAVSSDIIQYSLLNGSYPGGNITLTPGLNSTAVLAGTLGQVAIDTTTPFTIRATELHGTTVMGVSDRTFDITVAGPTPPSFATIPGMLGDTTTLHYAELPAAPIGSLTVNGNNHVVVSTAPYNLTNYGLTNNTAVYIAGITGTGYSNLLNKNLYYVGNADSGRSTFELFLNAGNNNTPTNPVIVNSNTASTWTHAGGSVGRVANDSVYFSTQIMANAGDPDVTPVFEVVGGQLPDGLEMTTTGLISGYPTNKRVTKDSANANVYWGAVDVNGNPSIKLDEFTVKVSTVSGSTTANYCIGISNQETVWKIGQHLANTNYTFPGRLPVILNDHPLTQVISNTDPYFSYYTTEGNIGRFTQDNQLVHKMIGHNFNATEQQGSEYGLSYTITGLSAGIADNANAFVSIVSPTSTGNAANGWINGTLGNIGTDINTYKFNVTLSSANLVGQVNTTANTSNYSSIVLVDSLYGLHTGQTVSLGNAATKYTVATVSPTVKILANIASGSNTIYVGTTVGLAVNANVTFTGISLGNIANTSVHRVASISAGVTGNATFTNGSANIIVDNTTRLLPNTAITFANTVAPFSNTSTYYVRGLFNTITGTATTTNVDSNIKVGSTVGLTTGGNITVSTFAPIEYRKSATKTFTGTTNFSLSSTPANTANLNVTGNLVMVSDVANLQTNQVVRFTGTSLGNLVANTDYVVANVYSNLYLNNSTGLSRQRASIVELTTSTSFTNANVSATATFKGVNPNTITSANYAVASVDPTNRIITVAQSSNIANVLSAGVNASMTFTVANVNTITVTSAPGNTTAIKATTAGISEYSTYDPSITLANLTPDTTGEMYVTYSAPHITLTTNGNLVVANTTANTTVTTEDSPPLVAGPYEYRFVMAGTLNTGIGWTSVDGNLGTINTGSTSMLNIEATFGSDSIETTATIANGNANISVVSAKSLSQYQPVTFSGTTVGNISNIATYYIKSNVSDASTSLTISRTLGGNVVTPNASGTMTLRSTISDGRFKLIDGNLPAGLKLLSTGDIVGRVAFQPTENYQVANTATTYNFTVRAYSKKYAEITKDRQFSITTVQKYVEPYDNLYVSGLVKETQRAEIDNLLTHISGTQDNDVTKNIYRSSDVNFGVSRGLKYGHMYGVATKMGSTFYEAYAAAITKNHYYKNLTLGDLKTAVARDASGKIVYEVVYSPIQDNLVSSGGVSISKDIYWAKDIITQIADDGTPLVNYGRELSPNSLINMRQQIEDTIGRINNSDVLPLWMVTQQNDGNVLGFVPCWVLCYTKPGKSATVLSSINTYLADNYFSLNQVSFDMDRFEVDRALTYVYGATGTQTWPELTATFITGNSAITVNNTAGLVPNQAIKFVGTAVEGVNVDATYWVSNVHQDTKTIWVRDKQYGNTVSTALIPQANGTMTLSTVPKSTMVADTSQDTYVIFTQNNIIG
jgi:hypothetical protein